MFGSDLPKRVTGETELSKVTALRLLPLSLRHDLSQADGESIFLASKLWILEKTIPTDRPLCFSCNEPTNCRGKECWNMTSRCFMLREDPSFECPAVAGSLCTSSCCPPILLRAMMQGDGVFLSKKLRKYPLLPMSSIDHVFQEIAEQVEHGTVQVEELLDLKSHQWRNISTTIVCVLLVFLNSHFFRQSWPRLFLLTFLDFPRSAMCASPCSPGRFRALALLKSPWALHRSSSPREKMCLGGAGKGMLPQRGAQFFFFSEYVFLKSNWGILDPLLWVTTI